jgi:hypothetical protein
MIADMRVTHSENKTAAVELHLRVAIAWRDDAAAVFGKL